MALLTGLLCLRTGQAIRRYGGPAWAGWCAALLVVVMPPVIIYSRLVMAEILLSWLCLEAVLAFACWMDRPDWKLAAWFAFWATAACLTKVTAVWLAPMVGLAILFSGRWKLLKEPSLWVSGLAVALLTLPWYLLAPGALHQASPDSSGVMQVTGVLASLRVMRRAREGAELLQILSIWMGPFLFLALWGARELWRRGQTIAPVVAAGVVGMAMMRFAVLGTGYEDRTALPLVAPLIVCAAGAAASIARFPIASAVTFALFAFWSVAATPPKTDRGVGYATQICLRPEYRNARLLVATHHAREGALVAETALGERRPTHYVLRASKILARSTWTGRRYQLLVADAGEVMSLLDRVPVGLLVFETDPRIWTTPHLKLLAQTITANPGRFRLLHSGAGPLRVYEVTGYRDRPRNPVSMFMYGLGRSIGGGADDGGAR
jgi:Dolichyl-phosphate-mannose-protein mannosyltransferase